MSVAVTVSVCSASIITIFGTEMKTHVRIPYNPRKREHLLAYAHFVKYNSWKDGCQFELSPEWLDVPSMCKDMTLRYYLESAMKNL